MSKAAIGSQKIRVLLTPIAGLSFLLFATFFVFVALIIDSLCDFPRFPSGPTNIVLSIPLIFLGLFIVSWSILHFYKVHGTAVPFKTPTQLILSGPYAHVRNPMLSGVIILLFGMGFAFGSISLIFFFTPLFILINVMELKSVEEPELEMRLGREYLEYKNKTPMFFPRRIFKSRNQNQLCMPQPPIIEENNSH